MIHEKLYYIHLSYATFAIITDYHSSIIKDVAPIGNWCKGKNIAAALLYYTKKGASITLVKIRYYDRTRFDPCVV